MKSKRDLLKEYVTYGNCNRIECENCPYCSNNCCKLKAGDRLSQIGAMALLRMFSKKKKPMLSVGTKIMFSDGRIAEITQGDINPYLSFPEEKGFVGISYLIGRTWEVVEE